MSIDRRQGIGASEVAALAESSPWDTPVSVWMRKVGLAPERESSPAMAIGQVLEPVIVRATADREAVRLTRNRQAYRHPRWPDVPLFATPDAFGPGRRLVAEVKYVAHHLADWRDGPPVYVRLQVQAQLAVFPKAQAALVGALVGGELRTWTVDRVPAVIDRLEADVAAWWSTHVVQEVAPVPLGPADAWALLRARVSATRTERAATEDEAVVAAHLAVILAEKDALEDQERLVRQELAEAAQGTDLVGNGWTAGWHHRRSTDWRAVAAATGATDALIDDHTTTVPVFAFRRAKSEESAA